MSALSVLVLTVRADVFQKALKERNIDSMLEDARTDNKDTDAEYLKRKCEYFDERITSNNLTGYRIYSYCLVIAIYLAKISILRHSISTECFLFDQYQKSKIKNFFTQQHIAPIAYNAIT